METDMNIDTIVSWTAFIAIIFGIYVVPKYYTIHKVRKQKVKNKTKRKLPPPAPLLGVIYPAKRRKEK
jgi:hypothetical protein